MNLVLPAKWLLISAALELVVSCLVGFLILVPMQPWAQGLADRWPPTRVVMSVHLDLVMLALTQVAAAFGISVAAGTHDHLVAVLLISSGWLNVTPYLWRMFGVNAFVLAGRPLQRVAALLSLGSTVALTGGWVILLVGWL